VEYELGREKSSVVRETREKGGFLGMLKNRSNDIILVMRFGVEKRHPSSWKQNSN
jgi:hypothetical protein